MKSTGLHPGIFLYCGTPDIYTELSRLCEDGTCKPRLQFLGAITEISLCSTHMSCVRHRIFSSFRKTEIVRTQLFALFSIQSVVHNI